MTEIKGCSREWNKCYVDNTQLSVWPWSDVVSLLHRHCNHLTHKQSKDKFRVLELGCGAGANIPLFCSLALDYHAIEGSSAIVEMLHQRYPELIDKIIIGDFTLEQPFECDFDLVIDRSSVTHNNTLAIKNALKLAFDSLKPNGVFIGTDWFSKKHDDFLQGDTVDDEYTRANHRKGQFVEVGKVHYSDEAHLRDLFSKFQIIFMEEKLLKRYEPPDHHQFGSWSIVAKKL